MATMMGMEGGGGGGGGAMRNRWNLPFFATGFWTFCGSFFSSVSVEAGGPTFYDAFVCYHPEGEDLKFVKTMIEKMECAPHNLKLFVPHRDDLPGASKHVISAKLIQDR